MKITWLLLLYSTVFISSTIYAAECPNGIILAKKSFLDQDQRRARRLILEPGTPLKCIKRSGQELFVTTPTGITGKIKYKSVHIFKSVPFKLAYPVTSFRSKSGKKKRWFYPGEYYPYKDNDDSDHILTIGHAVYSVEKKNYISTTSLFLIPEEDIDKFNYIDQEIVKETEFPEWNKIKEGRISFSQEWGCGKSISKVLTAGAKVEGSASTQGGFFSWISAKFGLSAEAGTNITITKNKKDEKTFHKVTYWDLVSNNNKSLLTIAVEKYYSCDRASDEPINYKFHFPNGEFEEIIIDEKWATKYKFKDGGAVPIRLSNIDDFYRFSTKLFDHYNIYCEISDQIRDFVIFISANIR